MVSSGPVYDSSSGIVPLDRKIAKGPVTHTPQYSEPTLTDSKTRVAVAFEAHGYLSGISVGTSDWSLEIQVSS